jgi:hypothetical protein
VSTLPCPNCQRPHPADQLGPDGWCHDCRHQVVRRATRVGYLVGVLAALLVAGVEAALGLSLRFLIAWIAIAGGAAFFAFKITQRVAFEYIRSRGVPPPSQE